MHWSCAFAIGSWGKVLLEGAAGQAWLGLSLLLLTQQYSRVKWNLLWAVVGWFSVTCVQHAHRQSERSVKHVDAAEWLLVSPRFVPTQSNQESEVFQRGIWDAIDAEGRHFLLWMSAPTECCETTSSAMVALEPLPSSDLTSSFDFSAYLQSMGVQATGTALAWGSSANSPNIDDVLKRFALAWRIKLRNTFSTDGGGLIVSVFAGDRSCVSPRIRNAFQDLGLSHLLAVSGYHVGLVAGIFLILLRAQNRFLKFASSSGILMAAGFVIACGSPVSGCRSLAMLIFGWIWAVRGKSSSVWASFGLAASLIVMINPRVPLMLGAQLSFLATGSLLALGKLSHWWRVPLRAQFATSVVTVPQFGVLPWAFFLANLMAGPAMLVLGVLVAISVCSDTHLVAQWAQWWSFKCSSAAIWIAETWPIATSTTRVGGPIGVMLLLPFSSFWIIRLMKTEVMQKTWIFSLGTAACLSAVGILLHLELVSSRHEPLLLWRLKGKPSCSLLTDGFGACAWCDSSQEKRIANATARLRLEGPSCRMDLDPPAQPDEKKWIQPPLVVWTHREESMSSSALEKLD